MKAAIPPGRYTVTLAPDRTTGLWMRCSAVLCGTEYSENRIDSGTASGAGFTSVMQLEPTDVAVYISGVILTRV